LVTIGIVEVTILLRGANKYCTTFYISHMNCLKFDAGDFHQKKILSVGFVPMLLLLSYFASTCGRKRVPTLPCDTDCPTWVKFAVKRI
jgi:hypothetical protein